MGTQTRVVRNKSSPEDNLNSQRSVYQDLIDQINAVGAGIWRIQGFPQDNGEGSEKQFSGLLLDAAIKNGKLIYIIVNGGRYEVVVKDTEKCFCWRKLVEAGETFQFIPVTKANKLTFQSSRVRRILKLDPTGFKQKLRDYIKGRRK